MAEVEMSTKLFTEKEIKILSCNQYVKSVSMKCITYTDEFKRIFIAAHKKGESIKKIFDEHGFDVEALGKNRIDSASNRWRDAYEKNGIYGLNDNRQGNSGRPSDKEFSIKEKYLRLEAQNNLLKAENELLKKMCMMERGLRRKK